MSRLLLQAFQADRLQIAGEPAIAAPRPHGFLVQTSHTRYEPNGPRWPGREVTGSPFLSRLTAAFDRTTPGR